MRTLAIAVAVLLAATGLAQQPTPTPTPDVQALGPQVGATVPGFSLPDHTGRPRTLQSVMGPKGALVVFFRSADW